MNFNLQRLSILFQVHDNKSNLFLPPDLTTHENIQKNKPNYLKFVFKYEGYFRYLAVQNMDVKLVIPFSRGKSCSQLYKDWQNFVANVV